jgi:hypothetical protein
MGHSLVNQFLSFESCLVRTHKDSRVHLEQVYFLKSNLAANVTGANVKMWKPTADNLVFIIFVFYCWNSFSKVLLLLLNEVNIVLNLLDLGSRDSFMAFVAKVHLIVHVVELSFVLVDHL